MAIAASTVTVAPVHVGPVTVGPVTVGLVQQFVECTGQLYSLPAAAAEVLRLTGEPTIDPRAIKQCVESDPALAARILRVVNSSLFGPSRQVTDLNQALTLLGVRPLKILVLGFSLPKELFAGLEAEVLSRYWKHTLVKAVAARELSERLWHLPGDEAFLAGLVQDIGMLALIQHLGDSYQKLLDHVRTTGGPLLACELDALGFDHLVLSARLLAHWGLPPGLCSAISVPPDTTRIGALSNNERTLPQLLHLAELLARLIEQPYSSALHDLLTAGAQYCGLTYERLQPVVATLQGKVEELAEVLSLELLAGHSYVDLLLTARERLADETATAADDVAALAIQLRCELARATSRNAAPRTAAVVPQPSQRTPDPPDGSIRPRTSHTSRATAVAEPGLTVRLASALHTARQQRIPLTLALFEIDRFSDLLVQLGPAGMSNLVNSLRSALAVWSSQHTEALLLSDSQLGLVWSDCSRSDAVQLARQILATVKAWSRQQFSLHTELTLSAGLATLAFASKNYPPEELTQAAERCLSGARLSGGDTAKSIEF
jgi:HD-like signal output (HDOD) protein/GGDEF domain-containing protein